MRIDFKASSDVAIFSLACVPLQAAMNSSVSNCRETSSIP